MNNQSIKFLSVTIRNFRGIPGELVIPLDAPLTVIHAANGTGKSTICYALEWLVTGKVYDLNTSDFSCQWGAGETSVSASCLIGEVPYELTRNGNSLSASQNGSRKRRVREDFLLELLAPASISTGSVQAIRKAKRGWLRNSRWLYSNSLSVLIDNNKAEERQQIFADILGLGHLTSTLRELREYRKALPSTKGLQDSVSRLSTEIAELEIKLAESSPWKERAEGHLSKIFQAFPPSSSSGSLGDDFKVAQLRVRLFEQKVQHEFGVLGTLSEQWAQYHAGQGQLSVLRQTLSSLVEASQAFSNEHSQLSAELSAAQVKAADGERSVIWAKERLELFSRWETTISTPSIAGYFSAGDTSQSQLYKEFVELSWTPDKQEAWLQSVSYLILNSTTVVDLVQQKRDLESNVVHPPVDIVNTTRLAEEAKSFRVKAEADFNAFSNVLGKLKAMGKEIAHSHDDGHCPLCNYDWGTSDKLRLEIAGKQLLTPALSDAAQALAVARQSEQESLTALSLANNQKAAYDAYMVRLNSVNGELTSIAVKTKYLDIMGAADFSNFDVGNLTYLQGRVRAAIELRGVFERLTEVESVFQITPLEGAGARIAQARVSLIDYRDYYQAQANQANPEKQRLSPLVRAAMENIQAKSQEITGVNSNIAATSQTIGQFDTLWKEVVGNHPVLADSYNAALSRVEEQRGQVDTYNTMLAECEAVVSIDLDSARLRELKVEKEEFSKKLKAGTGYIAEADRTIENYAQHVKQLTTSSLAPLLSPAAELFSRMHANEVYKGLSVSEGDDAFKWTVFAEGHEFALDAEEKFSQGQRQDLALSLYLARARNTGGSFLLDEPIAHLDDLNRVAMLDIFRLVATSMPNMNVILTTASDSLARHMAQKFSSITDRHLLNTIQLEGNPRTGVTVSVTRNVPA